MQNGYPADQLLFTYIEILASNCIYLLSAWAIIILEQLLYS